MVRSSFKRKGRDGTPFERISVRPPVKIVQTARDYIPKMN
jgi:hypothetical protein